MVRTSIRTVLLSLTPVLLFANSSVSLAQTPPPILPAVPVPDARVMPHKYTGDPQTRDIPFLAWHRPGNLSARGYTEVEIMLSGQAREYEYWDDEGEQAYVQPTVAQPGDYTTRMIIRRPKNPADFNGVVYLEILNATARYDGSPMWNLTWRSIVDQGAIYAGITYSDTTADFLRDTWGSNQFPAPLDAQPRNRSRYADMNIRTRAYTWDIVNQAAALLKQPGLQRNPLNNFAVDTIIVTGYSQSARYVTTHANSFSPAYTCNSAVEAPVASTPGCTQVVDGHIVAAGGSASSRPDGARSNSIGDRRNCEISINRSAPCIETATEPTGPFIGIPAIKVMRFTTESDIKSVRVRQEDADNPNLRTYEVAGTSHVDFWGNALGRRIAKYQFGFLPERFGTACDLPLNPISTGIPLSAIQFRLARWIQADELPPPSDFIDFTGSFDDGTEAWLRDADDNATGGVRPPRLEVPLGSYFGTNPYSGPSPSPQEIFCATITGGGIPFTRQELISRYTNQSTLEDLTRFNTQLAIADGFLLPIDRNRIMFRTRRAGLPE